MKNQYLAYCLLKQKYHQACATGRNLRELGEIVRELEAELWPVAQPSSAVRKVDKDAR